MQPPIQESTKSLSGPNQWNPQSSPWLARVITMKNTTKERNPYPLKQNLKHKYSKKVPLEEAKFSALDVTPKILLVCRRTERKNKYINYIGEYHIDLIQKYGGVPIIVPRTPYTLKNIDQYLPIHGFIIAEGEDLGTDYEPYENCEKLDDETINTIEKKHPGDTISDINKDELEWKLLDYCIKEKVPFLGLCRGCQIMNVKCGGKLWYDINLQVEDALSHIDYDNYDNHRHPIYALPNTPMSKWFESEYKQCTIYPKLKKYLRSDQGAPPKIGTISVNSYHHQGVKSLATCFSPMAISPDGLIEAYYDPNLFNPDKGKFCAAFQFHPERMMNDYPGCVKIYEDFITACKNFKYIKNHKKN